MDIMRGIKLCRELTLDDFPKEMNVTKVVGNRLCYYIEGNNGNLVTSTKQNANNFKVEI